MLGCVLTCGARNLYATVESSVARCDVLAVMWFRIEVFLDVALRRGRHISEYLNPWDFRCVVSYKEDTKDVTNGRKGIKCTLQRKE